VPVSRKKNNKEKRFLEDMKGLDEVLSQETIAFGSQLDNDKTELAQGGYRGA